VRLPRDVSGHELGRLLGKLGYQLVRQDGSHMRFRTQRDGEYYETIPDHDHLRPGTLRQVLRHLEEHHGLDREKLLDLLFS